MKKLISILSAAVSAAASVPFFSTADTAADEAETIKIMCIGDSITDGYVPEYTGSYRKFLYHGLTEKGYSIDMVGAKDGGWSPEYTDPATGESFQFDNENTGYSGYSIKAYPGRSGILETLQQSKCLQEKKPDIVTLQIGTNNIIDNRDMGENRKDLEELVEYIISNIPEESVLFISTIPAASPNREGVRDWFMNYRHSADWQTQYDDAAVEMSVSKAVKDYNDIVCQSDGKYPNLHVSLAGSGINDANKAELLFDGVHPNNDGYRLIGCCWTDIIDEYLRSRSGGTTTSTTSATTVTTTTATVPETDPRCTVSDLVRLSRFLLGESEDQCGGENFDRYDICNDNVLDTYDLVLMRKLLVAYGGTDFV